MKKLSTLNSQLSTSKGFTLIELIVVMAILGILLTIVIIAVNPLEQISKARDANKKTSISQIGNSISNYRASNNGDFPTDSTWDTDLISKRELDLIPKNPSDSAGCAINLKPGPTSGWCYETYTDSSNGSTQALLYAILDSKMAQQKCNLLSGEIAYYVWASINGGSGTYCSNGSNMVTSFNDHKNFVDD